MDLSRSAPRFWVAAPLAAGLIAAGLGSFLVGRKSLSTDEAFTVFLARRDLGDLLGDADSRVAQLGHLLVLHPVARVDEAEWAVRAPSVLAAALAAVLLFVLGDRLFGRVAGAAAAFALALHAGVVSAAQLAQPYTLALLGIVVATLLFVLTSERSSTGLLVAYAASVVVLPLLHPAATSVVAAHLAAAIVRERRPAKHALAAGVGLVLATPLLVLAALDRDDADGESSTTLGELAEGVARAVGWNPALLVLAALGVAAAAVRLQAAATWKAVLVGGLALAPLLALVLTAVALPVFPAWALVLTAPGLALGAGAGVAALTERQALAAVAALVAVGVTALVVNYLVGPTEDWRRAARAVRLVTKPSETVVVLPERARPAFAYYAPEIETTLAARGDAAWVVAQAGTPTEAIELGRSAVSTPRYALRRQFRYGDGLRLQHWIRP